MTTPNVSADLKPLLRSIDALAEDPGNARVHDEASIAAIARSLERFGQRKPVVVDGKGRVVAGNGTLRAARRLGWTHLAATEADGLGDPDLAGYGVVDNRTSDLSRFDPGRLRSALEIAGDVREDAALAFDPAALAAIQKQHDRAARAALGALVDPLAPETPKDPTTKPGDLYWLGRHRLLCGDATKPRDVARLIDGATPFLCVTDPPYGVDYDPAWRSRAAAEGHLAYAASRVGEVPNDHRADWREAWALFSGDVLYSWHPAGATSLVHAAAIEASGFALRMQIIWAKSNFPIGRGDYHVRHEPCWYAVREGRSSRRTDDRTQTTLWTIDLDANVPGGHSTQKPLECMARPIRNHGAPGDGVYDPFVGSGTTLVAAEQLDRTCYAMEISPAYCDVVVARWEALTGRKAERDPA